MALRRSRQPVSFNSLEVLERLVHVIGEIKTCSIDGSLDSGRIHGFNIRLRDGLRNIERFSHLLGRQCHTNIVIGIEEVLHMLEQMMSDAGESAGYVPPRNSGHCGRPYAVISREQLEYLVELRFSISQMSQVLHVSPATIKRRLRHYGIRIRQTYARIPDTRLDSLVSEISHQFPNSGYRMIQSHLDVRGYRVPERRVRKSLARVDPLSVAYRWRVNGNIHRRQYHVLYPNAIWHIDANLSLCRWKFYVHGAVDGFSRLVTYLACSTTNDATTTLKLFVDAGNQFGFPSRVRSDFGGENIDVAQFMLMLRGTNRGSHLTGRSIHNQRIERLWRDVFTGCLSLYYHLFYHMEDSGVLDSSNNLHVYALQYVYTPRINRSLREFQTAWNRHPMRTSSNQSPIQLWVSGMLRNYNSSHLAIQEVFSNNSVLTTGQTSESESLASQRESESSYSELEETVHELLHLRVDPLQHSTTWGIDLYVTALQVLLQMS